MYIPPILCGTMHVLSKIWTPPNTLTV